ncbi:DUF2141 domain-containing protein [Mesonia sp. MT50]|uniref:DUF2141 domain-containing protein n=1 Tax=Mesonia profundi TaxID=3070998 RepID=A0ABU1A124_9FLAO|nr:DUF2141 domain-containing protein [Mesonia profundi]MDQ7917408.1 DUF2141 domain-containing protein [Mesonia profundi]
MHYLISLLLLVVLNQPANPSPELFIEIHGIEKDVGFIEMGLYNKQEGFLEEGEALKTYRIPVKNKKASIKIPDLLKGNYAISLYHDENGDTKCNRNFIGVPKEPYGFSTNFKPKFSAPSFKDCEFSFQESLHLDINLIH